MLRRLAPVVAMALTVAACGGGPTGPPPPTPTTSTTSIDLRAVYEHPCATLTAAQRHQLGLPPRVRESAGDETAMCKWSSNDDVNFFLSLDLRSDPLAAAYESKDERDPDGKPLWPLFEPREIRGLPAVVRAYSKVGDHCAVIVDAGGGQGISLTGSIGTTPDPTLCDRLVTAAGWVVDTIK